MDKIETIDTKYSYEKALNSLKKLSARNMKLIKEYDDAASIGMAARKEARKKQVGVRARIKNIYLLKIAAKFLKKDFDKISVEDMKKLVKALSENKLKKQNGKNYSEQTKANIKKTIIIFLRFIFKSKPRKFEKLTEWIDTGFKKKEKQELNEEEVKKLLAHCNNLRQKVLVAVLFDSGVRIEEFLNIRIGDLTEVQGAVPYYRILIRGEFSKTEGRTISLFWQPTTELINDWLSIHPNKDNNEAVLFDTTYDAARKVLHKIGKRALKKSVTPHLLRHSSATYYAGRGADYFQLCKRYGWAIGSNVPHTYIHKSGIKEKEFADKMNNEKLEDIRLLMEKIKNENKELKEVTKEQDEKFSKMLQLAKVIDGMVTSKKLVINPKHKRQFKAALKSNTKP